MNPQEQLPNPQPSTEQPTDPFSPAIDSPITHRRYRSKIARLPVPLREAINHMLEDGLAYAEIIQRLGPDAADISESNMTRWFQTGHQDWIKNQRWLEQTRTRLDFAVDVIGENQGSNIHQANLHLAATQLIASLQSAGEALLADHPDQYVSLVNSITRLSREALNFQRYREACAAAKAEVAKLLDPDRKLTEKETLAIVEKLDEILGFK